MSDINSIEERLRSMEEHMRRVLENEDRFREFEMMHPFLHRDESAMFRDNAPIEFIRPSQSSRHPDINVAALSDQLLHQLSSSI